MRTVLKSKIHRARVTQADLHYEGSITIDADLMDAADILPFEQVHVLDVDNGSRLTTYAIEGARNSGQICINGAADRLVSPGDTVILLTYKSATDDEARTLAPALIYVDEFNHIARIGNHIDPAQSPDGGQDDAHQHRRRPRNEEARREDRHDDGLRLPDRAPR